MVLFSLAYVETHLFFSLPPAVHPRANLSCSLTAFWSPDSLFGFVSLMNSVCLTYATLFPKQHFSYHILIESTLVDVGAYI